MHVNMLLYMELAFVISLVQINGSNLSYTPHHSDIELCTGVQPWHTCTVVCIPFCSHTLAVADMHQLLLGGLSSIRPSHYQCEPTPSHWAMGALVWIPSSGSNSSRLGKQLSWCAVSGLLELVGEHLLICQSGWTGACDTHWHVPDHWCDHRAKQ